MREPPPHVSEDDVLATVGTHWSAADATEATHLPVGFGAHHWRVGELFVTFDRLEPKRSPERLEAAYAAAAALHEAGLEFVHPSVPSRDGAFTVPLADGALSCTRWLDAVAVGALDLPWTTEALRRLHALPPPRGLPQWRPLVGPGFAAQITELGERDWGPGPFAGRARHAVRARLADIARWTERYHHLARAASERAHVPTHGEPDQGNQLATHDGHLLIDWESLKLAPAERDLRTLVDAGCSPAGVGADPEMLELFALEWRLDEISQYAAWFAAPHTGTDSDRVAFGGLLHELTRP